MRGIKLPKDKARLSYLKWRFLISIGIETRISILAYEYFQSLTRIEQMNKDNRIIDKLIKIHKKHCDNFHK